MVNQESRQTGHLRPYPQDLVDLRAAANGSRLTPPCSSVDGQRSHGESCRTPSEFDITPFRKTPDRYQIRNSARSKSANKFDAYCSALDVNRVAFLPVIVSKIVIS
jgi:hypothetical protein